MPNAGQPPGKPVLARSAAQEPGLVRGLPISTPHGGLLGRGRCTAFTDRSKHHSFPRQKTTTRSAKSYCGNRGPTFDQIPGEVTLHIPAIATAG